MGFRSGAYATIWDVESISNTNTKAQISISKKNKDTGEYDTEFSGFVNFLGTAVAGKAARLKKKDRIKLGDVDVTTKYDKDKNRTYTNFKVFGFEELEQKGASSAQDDFSDDVDDGEISEGDLPF